MTKYKNCGIYMAKNKVIFNKKHVQNDIIIVLFYIKL